jgi:hypothetical protein
MEDHGLEDGDREWITVETEDDKPTEDYWTHR